MGGNENNSRFRTEDCSVTVAIFPILIEKAGSVLQLDSQFIQKYNVAGPRYTSYPPATQFQNDDDVPQWESHIEASNNYKDGISLYFHIPFCPERCLFCGCNTEIGAKGSLIRDYHQALLQEMDAVLDRLDSGRPVTQIHFGGGTPNAVPIQYLREIVDKAHKKLQFAEHAEIAIECDPNFITSKRLGELRDIGFNRISFGLQDFNTDVLEAVNRRFPGMGPDEIIGEARGLGFFGINLDLIYGLPRQNPESFQESLEKTVKAGPDRVAVFSYAHVPWIKPHQEVLTERGLPAPEQKIRMAIAAYQTFVAAGYLAIGMDHFAKPEDDLGRAFDSGRLHRNFQGYCTKETTGQVYAFGSSAISQLTDGYAQNVKGTQDYIKRIFSGNLPLEKTYYMSEEDKFYREVINGIMCRGVVEPEDLATRTGLSRAEVMRRISSGMEKTGNLVADGVIKVENDKLEVTPKGWLVVRCVAMLFDPLLNVEKNRFSQTV